jgi:uncharacterized protein (DUF2461 family)
MSRFEGFGSDVQMWFEGLEANNSKDYFAAGRDFYEESIRNQMAALSGTVRAQTAGLSSAPSQIRVYSSPVRYRRVRDPRTGADTPSGTEHFLT